MSIWLRGSSSTQIVCSSVLRITFDSSVERLSAFPRRRRSPADQYATKIIDIIYLACC
jgi:hypothetical protein